jgi:hypothetical protein
MSLRHKELNSITEQDLQSLIDNQVAEGKDIEFKRELPAGNDEAKKEFLADVSSFANTVGGDIIYGMEEENGVAKQLTGVQNLDIDGEKLRLEDISRQGIDPRIQGFDVSPPIKLTNSNVILIIRIPQSWASPHIVKFKKSSRFFARNSAGKYQLDVSEIRAKFLLSETAWEKARNFRLDRLSKIIAEDTPVPLLKNPMIVMHLIPLLSVTSSSTIDMHSLQHKGLECPPIYASDRDSIPSSYNFDGWYSYVKLDYEKPECYSYAQLFRNGSVEAVEAFLLRPHNNNLVVLQVTFEDELMKALRKLIVFQQSLGIEPPVIVFLSVLGVRDYEIRVSNYMGSLHLHPIDRDNLILPEVILESFQFEADIVLRPIFDAIWNACGYPHCLDYNWQTGKWEGNKR